MSSACTRAQLVRPSTAEYGPQAQGFGVGTLAQGEPETEKMCTVVSRFSGLGPSPQKRPLNRDNPLNRIH